MFKLTLDRETVMELGEVTIQLGDTGANRVSVGVVRNEGAQVPVPSRATASAKRVRKKTLTELML